MKKKTTIISLMENNIGQVSEKNANAEIERLNKQGNGVWRKDYSDYLECPDETDDEVLNPCPRQEGNCWIVK